MNIQYFVNSHFRFGRLLICMALLSSLIVLVPVSDSVAQRRKSAIGNKNKEPENKPNDKSTTPAKRPAVRPGVAANRKKEDDEFAPQTVTLEVQDDGIQLAATWFPPIQEDEKKKKRAKKKGADSKDSEEDAEPGKSTVPFILVHDWSRSRADLFSLGQYLQSQGHAAIIPDLRGHGQSRSVVGTGDQLDYTKFKKAQKASAVADIDQCKRFLQEKNNEGILNLDMLNIIAVGDSSHLAIAWAMSDWTWEPVAGIKQGKDVKSLILFSPTPKFAGSSLKKLVKKPLISGRGTTALPMLVIWGGQSDAAQSCSDWVESLRKFRPEAPEGDDLAARWFKQNLFHFQAPTDMRGFEIAGNPNAKQIWAFANDFVSQKVVAFKDQCPWQIRGAEAVLKARQQK